MPKLNEALEPGLAPGAGLHGNLQSWVPDSRKAAGCEAPAGARGAMNSLDLTQASGQKRPFQ